MSDNSLVQSTTVYSCKDLRMLYNFMYVYPERKDIGDTENFSKHAEVVHCHEK